jgi:hypothetical protein
LSLHMPQPRVFLDWIAGESDSEPPCKDSLSKNIISFFAPCLISQHFRLAEIIELNLARWNYHIFASKNKNCCRKIFNINSENFEVWFNLLFDH